MVRMTIFVHKWCVQYLFRFKDLDLELELDYYIFDSQGDLVSFCWMILTFLVIWANQSSSETGQKTPNSVENRMDLFTHVLIFNLEDIRAKTYPKLQERMKSLERNFS